MPRYGGEESGGEGVPGGPNDIQQAAALSALAWSQSSSGYSGGAPERSGSGVQMPAGYSAEIDAWKKANAATSFQQQQDYMADLQTRMAKARAALAGLPLSDDVADGEPPPLSPPPVFTAPIPAPMPAGVPSQGNSGGEFDVRYPSPEGPCLCSGAAP